MSGHGPGSEGPSPQRGLKPAPGVAGAPQGTWLLQEGCWCRGRAAAGEGRWPLGGVYGHQSEALGTRGIGGCCTEALTLCPLPGVFLPQLPHAGGGRGPLTVLGGQRALGTEHLWSGSSRGSSLMVLRPDSWLTGMARTGDPSARGSPPPEPCPQGWDGTGRGPGRERVSRTRWSPPLPALRSGARPAGRAAWHGAPRETGQHAAHGRTVALVDTVSP